MLHARVRVRVPARVRVCTLARVHARVRERVCTFARSSLKQQGRNGIELKKNCHIRIGLLPTIESAKFFQF